MPLVPIGTVMSRLYLAGYQLVANYAELRRKYDQLRQTEEMVRIMTPRKALDLV